MGSKILKSLKELHSLLINHRRLYVQRSQSKTGADGLRFLKNLPVGGLDEKKLIKANDFLGNFDPSLTRLIYVSFLNYLSAFIQIPCHDNEIPLWLKNIYKNNTSRNLSPSLTKNIEKLFAFFGVSMQEIIQSIKDPQVLYCLAQYDRIFKILDGDNATLFWKLKISPLHYTQKQFLSQLNSINTSPEQKELLKARYAVQSIKAKKISLLARFFLVPI